MITPDKQAAQRHATKPSCVDAAIDALERFARTDPVAMSDLGAAYYVRAYHDDRPSDLLRSLNASEHAPATEITCFNKALAEEVLDITTDAIGSWAELAESG